MQRPRPKRSGAGLSLGRRARTVLRPCDLGSRRRSSRRSGPVTTLSPSESRLPARLDTASQEAAEGACSKVIRVVIGDDSFLAREGIARVLESIEDVELIAACVDFDELRATVERAKPDVVL